MLFGRNIAEHSASEPAYHRCTNTARYMVITRRNIGRQGSQGIKRCFIAMLELLGHIILNHVHRYVPRPFDHHLHIVLPRFLRKLTQGTELRKLRLIIRIRDASGRSPSPNEKLMS